MGPLDALHHLLNFVAPAAALAVVLVLCGRLMRAKAPLVSAWYGQLAVVFAVGCAVLAAGMVYGGRDGKMLTYAALVAGCASCQWVLLRGWR